MAVVNGPSQAGLKVGFLLGMGILLLPIVFVWWLLKPGYSTLSRVVGFGWLAIVLILAFGSAGNSPPTPVQEPAVGLAGNAAASAPAEPTSRWSYSSDTDEMRGTTSHLATVESTNELEFDFPYKGGHTSLTLRQRPEDGLNVVLRVEGQFLCSSISDDTVAVKFDEGPVQRFGCAEPSDHATGVLFIKSERRFVESLKTAKKLIVEAEFFQQGRRQMIFDVEGLEWPPKAAEAP